MRRLALPLVAVLGLAGLSGCGSGATSADAPPADAVTHRHHGRTATPPDVQDVPSPTVTGLPVPQDLSTAFGTLLQQRAQAVLDHDRAAFTAGLDTSDAGFVTAQLGWFANLQQLPVQRLDYTIEPTSLVRTGTSYWVVVDVGLQLDGFDTAPVVRPDRYRFTPVGRSGAYRLSSVTDAAWESEHGLAGQPWDLEPVDVRTRPGVLGVFDAATVRQAGPLMGEIERGVTDVLADVPPPSDGSPGWPGTVVVYVLGDPRFAAGLQGGADTQAHVDGVAFSVPASAADPTVASTRVLLSPDVLRADPVERERLVRHELTHVALGTRDDAAPGWLREGLAEWVSVQPLPVDERRLAAGAVRLAQRMMARHDARLPTEADLDGPDAPAHYALAWFACAWLAQHSGASAPWQLLDALDTGTGVRQAVRQVGGLSPDGLAYHAARLLAQQDGGPGTGGGVSGGVAGGAPGGH